MGDHEFRFPKVGATALDLGQVLQNGYQKINLLKKV